MAGWNSFSRFCFNSEKKTFCGRTCLSWVLITLYFTCYYACLAGFWSGMLAVFLYGMVDDNIPTLTGNQSLLKLSPGLSFKPVVKIDNPLLQLATYPGSLRDNYKETMNELLNGYDQSQSNCDFVAGVRVDSSDFLTPCRFPKDLLGPCSDPSKITDNVCIYITMNKIYGYLPPIEGNRLLVECGPANAYESMNLNEAKFYPSESTNESIGYFSTVAFPFANQEGYQKPLLAVMFPRIKKNTIVMVQCRFINTGDTEGYRFDLAVDDQLSQVFN